MKKNFCLNFTQITRALSSLMKPLLPVTGAANVRKLLRSAYLLALVLLVTPAAIVLSEQPAMPTDLSRVPAYLTIRTSDTDNRELLTFEATVIEALDAANITVGEKDLLSLPDDLSLEPGHSYELTITKRNNVTLSYAGFSVGAFAEEMSMVDLLSRSGFSLLSTNGGSRIEQQAANSGSGEATIIAYVNAEHRTERVLENIPFSTVTVNDPELYVGESKVRTEGVNGQRALIYDDLYENGVFVSRTQTGTEIIQNPVQKVIARGTKKKVVIAPYNSRTVNQAAASTFNKIKDTLLRNGSISYRNFSVDGSTLTVDGRNYTITDRGSRTITVYDGLQVCQDKGDHSPAINHKTASGIPAQRGLTATFAYRSGDKVTGTALPFGTLVFVEGYGLAVVADIHGSRTNTGMLDVCYDPGELDSGKVRVGKWSRTVYVLKTP